jgi:hypothetical protein
MLGNLSPGTYTIEVTGGKMGSASVTFTVS